MTQKELAAKAEVTEAAMSHYIRGDRTPRSSVLARIAKALDTTSDYLMDGIPQNYVDEMGYVKRLIAEMKKEILRQFGQEPLDHKDYGRIINDKHYHRLMGLIDQEKVVSGGYARVKKLQIAPTIMDQVTWEQLYAKTADALRIIYK